MASLAPLPKHSVATEHYPPNVAVARRRLEPLGVRVLDVDSASKLPLADGAFDLVLNRHSPFSAPEVFRILALSGHFLTQQVGGSNLNDLVSWFGVASKNQNWTVTTVTKTLRQLGITIRLAQEWRGELEFKDVGAMIYLLKAIPWIVADFNLDTHLAYLERLQAKLERGERLVFTQVRFIVHAQKE